MAAFHFITACSRPQNLPKLKASILAAKGKAEVFWHICFDSRINHNLDEYKDTFVQLYSAATYYQQNPGKSQINFVLTHFELKMFKGFIYVLDDDNLLPKDFLSYPYSEEESKIYLFPQIMWDAANVENCEVLREVNPIIDRIDQAQILIHSSIQPFYPLSYNGDSRVIEKLCKSHPYKIMNFPVYYNRLVWPDNKTEIINAE